MCGFFYELVRISFGSDGLQFIMDQGKGQIEGQTIQWPKEKGYIMIYKTLHRKLNIEHHDHNKIRG
jgi:hypothetical protein